MKCRLIAAGTRLPDWVNSGFLEYQKRLRTPLVMELHEISVATRSAGDNPQRLRSEQSSARLCGVAPVPVSSGRTDRNRPHRGGDRDANSALWRIALVRMHCHQPTKDYVTRRTAEGRTKKEILRCLKRYIAREAYPLLLGYGSAHDPGLPRRL